LSDPIEHEITPSAAGSAVETVEGATAAVRAVPRNKWKTGSAQITRALVAIVVALIVGGIVILLLGRNPLTFYADIFRAGVLRNGWQDSITRMSVLMLMGMGYVVAFRGGIWNIGGDGQFLLSAALVAGAGPPLFSVMPMGWALVILSLIGIFVGGSWTVLPAYLRASYGLNEIITSVMMSFIGIYIANILIKGPFRSEKTTVPQTDVMPFDKLLPKIPGTTIPVSIFVALAAVVGMYYVMTRTSVGLRLTVMGANARAALHAGLKVKRLIMGAFFASGAFIGLGASMEILGVWGYMRADWNPKFGLTLFALVFLARLNALAVIPLTGFFAVLTMGGHTASRNADLPNDFMLLLMGLILLFMTLSELISIGKAGRQVLGRRIVQALRFGREQ
jgi:general nucleoside transport system permease protein